ncbi:MAG: sensor histidine kinase [Actinomycetota bacterium]
MKRFRGMRLGALIISVVLLLGVGAAGFAANIAATNRSEQVDRASRLALSEQLQNLSRQFFLVAAKEANDFASSQNWSLTQNSASDRAKIHSFVSRATLLTYAGVLVDTQRNVLTAYAPATGLPKPNDPGFDPVVTGLLRGDPGLSSVMFSGKIPLVAIGVPILRHGFPIAVFLGFFRADTSLLQTYEETLSLGKTGRLWIADSTGRIVGSNQAALVGTLLPKIVLAQEKPGPARFVEYVRDGKRVVSVVGSMDLGGWYVSNEETASEFYGPIRSGSFHVLLAILALLVVAAMVVVVMNDLRSRALHRAFQYKGEMLANTSHELKTPITVILGCAATLGLHWRSMKGEDVDTFVSAIKRRSEDLARLVERILLAARLEAGQPIDLNPQPVNVAETLKRISEDFKSVSERHPVVLEAPPDLWTLADPTSVDQIVGLLAENAIKYSPDGGEIRIEAGLNAKDIVVRVCDHGIGISTDDQSHIFDAYYRGEHYPNAKIGGAGLGLGIARYLLERQGGHISVESKLGEGSVFEFTLPRTDSPEKEHALAG